MQQRGEPKMEATEFVKEFGWAFSKDFSFKSNKIIKALPNGIGEGFCIDLKRLVDSYELVRSYGGLGLVKKELQRQSILRGINPETERLREAITDVESCYD